MDSIDHPHEPQERPSVFGALEARRQPPGARSSPYEGDDRWIFVILSLNAPSIGAQRDIVSSISHPQDVDFNTLYSVGAIAAPATASWDVLGTLADTDLSVVVETLLNAGRLPNGWAARLAPELDSFVAGIVGSKRRKRFRGFEEVNYRLSSVMGASPIACLGDLNRYVMSVRASRLHVVGPDLPSTLQLLLDPTEEIPWTRLLSMHTVMSRWGLEDTFASLLLLRSLGDYEDALDFLREHEGSLLAHNQLLGPAEAIRTLLHDDAEIDHAGQRPRGSYFVNVTLLFAAFKVALQRGDAWSVFASIADIYNLDPVLTGFLPWDAIYELYTASAEITAHTAFASMLMAEDAVVGQRHPSVSFGAGKGAFIADLTSLIQPGRRSGATTMLLAQFKRLPPRSAAALTTAILQRPIIERLASSLPQARRWNDPLQPTEVDPISALRIDILRLAGAKQLISLDYLEQQVAREIEHVTLLYLQGRMRVGRVRMPWTEIARDLHQQFEALPTTTMRRAAAAGELPQSLVTRLAKFVADHLTGHVLYESEFGIDQALSNNLRHGVVLPRYLRAFEDAFQACWPNRNLQSWASSHLTQWFRDDAPSIGGLRDQVADTIREFIEVYLTVEKDNRFEQTLHREIVSLVEASVSRTSSSQSQLEQRVLGLIKRQLAGALATASKQLQDQVRADLSALIGALRRPGPIRPITGSFLDLLEANLEEAHEEVRSWLHIADARGVAIPFHLQQLVKLHLFSTSIYASDKLKVACAVSRDGKPLPSGDGAISGKYVDFFEVLVSNLLSNALSKSGDRLKTQAQLSLVVARGEMRIRCENVINERKLSETIAAYQRTLQLAQQPLGRNVLKDKLSGFQKMRAAYRSAFKNQPRINIPPISTRSRRFVIELISPAPEDLFT